MDIDVSYHILSPLDSSCEDPSVDFGLVPSLLSGGSIGVSCRMVGSSEGGSKFDEGPISIIFRPSFSSRTHQMIALHR